MASLDWALICREKQDGPNKTNNLLGVGNIFYTPGFPATLHPFLIASAWSGKQGESLEITLDILSADKKLLIPPAKNAFPFIDPTIHVFIEVPAIDINNPGICSARLIAEGRKVYLVPFRVEIIRQ